MYSDYVCANDVSYLFVLPYVINRTDDKYGIHTPLIVDSVGKVCSDELIIEIHRKTLKIESVTEKPSIP